MSENLEMELKSIYFLAGVRTGQEPRVRQDVRKGERARAQGGGRHAGGGQRQHHGGARGRAAAGARSRVLGFSSFEDFNDSQGFPALVTL